MELSPILTDSKKQRKLLPLNKKLLWLKPTEPSKKRRMRKLLASQMKPVQLMKTFSSMKT